MHIACLDLWRASSDAFLRVFRIQCIEQVVNNLCEGFCTRTVLKLRDTSLTVNLQANCSAAAEELRTQLHVPNLLLSAASQVAIIKNMSHELHTCVASRTFIFCRLLGWTWASLSFGTTFKCCFFRFKEHLVMAEVYAMFAGLKKNNGNTLLKTSLRTCISTYLAILMLQQVVPDALYCMGHITDEVQVLSFRKAWVLNFVPGV